MREKLREEVSRLLRGGLGGAGGRVCGGWFGGGKCARFTICFDAKKRSVLMKAGQDSFCMEGLAVGWETATSWAAAREFLRMRNVFEDTV